MVVKKDFYMYSTGVYMYSLGSEFENPEHVESGHHSVRILGYVRGETVAGGGGVL